MACELGPRVREDTSLGLPKNIPHGQAVTEDAAVWPA
jgi:hypothetical protein